VVLFGDDDDEDDDDDDDDDDDNNLLSKISTVSLLLLLLLLLLILILLLPLLPAVGPRKKKRLFIDPLSIASTIDRRRRNSKQFSDIIIEQYLSFAQIAWLPPSREYSLIVYDRVLECIRDV